MEGNGNLDRQGESWMKAAMAYKQGLGIYRHFRPDEPTYGPDEWKIFTSVRSSEPADARGGLRPEQASPSSG